MIELTIYPILSYFIIGLIAYKGDVKQNFILYVLITVVASLLVGLRMIDGGDGLRYNLIFDQIYDYGAFSAPSQQEYLFALIVSLIKSIGLDNIFIFIFFSFLSLGVKSYVFWKFHHRYAILALLVYIGVFYINLEMYSMRHALATSFILLGFYYYVKRNRFWYFLISIVIASGFHVVSVVFLISPLIFKMKGYLLGLLILLAGYFPYSGVGPSIISDLFPYMPRSEDLDVFLQNDIPISYLHVPIIKDILYVILFAYFSHRYKENLVIQYSFKLIVFGLIARIGLIDYGVISSRIGNLFEVIEPILLVEIMRNIRFRYSHFVLIMYPLGALLYMFSLK